MKISFTFQIWKITSPTSTSVSDKTTLLSVCSVRRHSTKAREEIHRRWFFISDVTTAGKLSNPTDEGLDAQVGMSKCTYLLCIVLFLAFNVHLWKKMK